MAREYRTGVDSYAGILTHECTPRNRLPVPHLECIVGRYLTTNPDTPKRHLDDWLQWLDTMYEQLDAELPSRKEAHDFWRMGEQHFRRYVRNACEAKYLELDVPEEGQVWKRLSALRVYAVGPRHKLLPIENRIIQDWREAHDCK